MHTNNGVVFSVGNHFHETVGGVHGHCATVSRKVKAAHFVIKPFLFALGFCHARSGDFRIGEDNPRHHFIVVSDTRLTANGTRSCQTLGRTFVCQHRPGCNIANGINVRGFSLALCINADEAALVGFYPNGFEANIRRNRAASYCK